MMAESAQLIALVMTVIGVIVALLGYVSTQSKNLREVISSGDKATSEGATKRYHDLANQFQATMLPMRADIETLKRESVRRDEVTAMDMRWSTNFTRLESKLDRLSEQMSHVPALDVSIKSCTDQVGALSKRLDAREARA